MELVWLNTVRILQIIMIFPYTPPPQQAVYLVLLR